MLSLAACRWIAQWGRCSLALSCVGESMRFSVEQVGTGFKCGRLSLRLKLTERLEAARHLTLISDEAFFHNSGLSEQDVLAASMWWLTRPYSGSLLPIPLHVVTSAHSVTFLGEATSLTVSLYVFSWQMTRLSLPLMPHLDTLEVRNCTCLRSVELSPQWLTDGAGGQVPTLRMLDIGETMIHSLRAVVALFPSLEVLHADGLTSVVDWWAASEVLGNLRELNATASNLADISWLPRLPQLEVLKLHGCEEIVDWSPIGQLPHLRELNCNYGRLTHIDWIAGCTELEQLFLYGCTGIVDGTAIGELSFLRYLNIGLHSFRTVGWLRTCAHLQTLWMQGATDKPVDDMDSIGDLRELRVLNMAFSAVRDISWLPKCVSLRELYLVGCTHVMNWRPIGELLRTAAALEVVDLRETNVFGVREWVHASAGLRELRLDETNLTMHDRLALSCLPSSVRVIL